MTHKELIEAVAMGCGITQKLADQAVGGTFELIAREVKEKGRVAVPGFGVFTRRRRKSRTIRNPQTNELMRLPETETVSFRPSKNLKRHVGNRHRAAVRASRRKRVRPR